MQSIGNWKLESTIMLSIIISNIHLTVLLLLLTSSYDGRLHLADVHSSGGFGGLHLKVVCT